jgi:Intracellular proteinase inhibitor
MLSLRNRTSRALRLTFPTTGYGVVVLRRRGRVVYASNSGFFPAFTSRTLAPRETYLCTLGPDELDVENLEPGRYEQVATIHTTRFHVRRRDWFSVE